MSKYQLKATGTRPSTNSDLVSYVADRKKKKDEIWQMRNNALVVNARKMEQLISIYDENYGKIPANNKQAGLFYKSSLAHQAWNILQGTKLDPDFIDFAPLGSEFDPSMLQKTKDLTQAHRVMRYKGGYEKARSESKSDLIWGNSFIEMSTCYDGDDPLYTEYTNAPFKEMRNFYGDTDIMRVIDYSIEAYVKEYDEEMLDKVTLGGILDTQQAWVQQKPDEERAYDSSKDIIQVVRYYDPARKIFADIHGGGGYIYKNLEGDAYQFNWQDDKGFSPFKESRFYQQISNDYFGWGVFDYIVNLANLETTISNATAMEAIWDAAAPSFLFTNDPDDMDKKMQKHLRNINRGMNVPIVQKDSGIGTKGQIQTLKKGVDNNNMQVWNDTTMDRATQFTNIDLRALSDFAPTAEQQKLKKIAADKLNLRVLLLNEEREKEFAIKEMSFLQNGTTKFHSYEIDTFDEVSESLKTEDGYRPPKRVKIKEILVGVKNLEMKIAPRLEGVLEDMDFMEIQTMQEDLRMLIPQTAAYDIAMEKYFAKKNPDWGLRREDFSTSTAPPEEEILEEPQGEVGQGATLGAPSLGNKATQLAAA